MKKVVWLNKSNGQLCVTIPKSSGIKEGDIVNISKEKIERIVYAPITADLFHYGHLQLLQKANLLGDFLICGLMTDEAIRTYKKEPIAGLKERNAILSALNCVDMIMLQHQKDPTENLKSIHQQFPHAKLILVYGSNWKETPGGEYIRKINGKVIKPPFYEKLSTENIIQKIMKIYKTGELKK